MLYILSLSSFFLLESQATNGTILIGNQQIETINYTSESRNISYVMIQKKCDREHIRSQERSNFDTITISDWHEVSAESLKLYRKASAAVFQSRDKVYVGSCSRRSSVKSRDIRITTVFFIRIRRAFPIISQSWSPERIVLREWHCIYVRTRIRDDEDAWTCSETRRSLMSER